MKSKEKRRVLEKINVSVLSSKDYKENKYLFDLPVVGFVLGDEFILSNRKLNGIMTYDKKANLIFLTQHKKNPSIWDMVHEYLSPRKKGDFVSKSFRGGVVTSALPKKNKKVKK